MMKNKKLLYGILAIVVVGLMIGFVYHHFFDPAPPERTPPPPVFYSRLASVYDFPSHRFGPSVYYDPDAEVKDIKLEFKIPGTVFELGEKIVVETWLTNTGNRPIHIYYGDPPAWVVFEDERGLKWIPSRGFIDILWSDQLESNESIHKKERLILQAGYPFEGIIPRYTLEPGTYTLHVFADFTFSDPASDRTKGVRIWAPPVQIEISESAVEYPQLIVGAEIARTQYQVGEEISIRPYIINMGKQSITVSGSAPLLFVKVYDTDNRRVLLLPEAWPSVLVMYTLSPGMPFEREYIFTLDQPGRYKVIAWAEFSLEKGYIYPLRAYADPIWIEVVTGSN